MTTVRIRPRTPADLAGCAAILRPVHEQDGYPAYWPGDPERFIAGETTLQAWVAVDAGEIVGHIALAAPGPGETFAQWSEATGAPPERLGVIARFFVAPRARRSGAGAGLFDAALAEARGRGLAPVLDVLVSNHGGIVFYERRGWRRVGETTLRLRDPEGATLPMLLYVAPDDVVGEIERVAMRAVPAADTATAGGWVLRATPGVRARRANSVLAVADDRSAPLDAWIDEAERFYAERGMPARFQLTPASRPLELAARLAERGYVAESPTLVCAGESAPLCGHSTATGVGVDVSPAPAPAWLATWCDALGADPAGQAGPQALWARIGPDVVFALARLADGTPAGTGMGVRDGRFIGVFNMATAPAARRRGVARATLSALARWGAEGGADRVYLQVDAANETARALYRSAGLAERYGYDYRVRALGKLS